MKEFAWGGASGFLMANLKEKHMYGQVLGKTAPVAGVTLLPATGNSRPLFFLATSLIVVGVAVLIASTVVARKSRSSEA